ncbi:MAG TPA: MgtC/SapB family protein [Candidatus Limnocylindrales bacterium]
MSTDIAFQFDILVRLFAAALCGAGLGLEREVHGHQAGMRTHMLVALGSAVFTIISMYGFPKTPDTALTDPTRISAQIVTGIGFLGAGAIIKYGTSIRGLTTAASLWVVAAVGLSAGAGAYFLAVAGTFIGLLALWPLHVFVGRLNLEGGQLIRLQLELKKIEGFAGVSRVLLTHHVETISVSSSKSKSGHLMELELRLPNRGQTHTILTALEALSGVEVRAVNSAEEA